MPYAAQLTALPNNEVQYVKYVPEGSDFGLYETIGYRSSQEDAAFRGSLTPETFASLTPVDIGHRLWTTYRLLDEAVCKIEAKSGTTASTTVYDGRGNLITATLADAVSFAVVYDKEGKVLGVIRLNSVTHKPEGENERIEAAGGSVIFWGVPRVNGILAVSRAIGDKHLKDAGVCSEATIDVTTISKICADLKVDPETIGKVQVITTCDGFTDGAGEDGQTKEAHEKYLLKMLQRMESPGKKAEIQLAEILAGQAIADGSGDNVSVAIQTLATDKACLVGVYDGHGGPGASTYVAEHIGSIFDNQCALTKTAYTRQAFSVDKMKAIYRRDNKLDDVIDEMMSREQDLRHAQKEQKLRSKMKDGAVDEELQEQARAAAVVAELLLCTNKYMDNVQGRGNIHPPLEMAISDLKNILNDSKFDDKTKICNFYRLLNAQHHDIENKTYLDVINADKTKSTKEFIIGIALLASCILIVPGIIMAVVYLTTGRHPFEFFQQNPSMTYTKALEVLERQVPLAVEQMGKPAVLQEPEADGDHTSRPSLRSP